MGVVRPSLTYEIVTMAATEGHTPQSDNPFLLHVYTGVGGVHCVVCLIKFSHERNALNDDLLHLIGVRLFRLLNYVTSSLVTCANSRFITVAILKSRSSTVFSRFKALTPS